MVHRPSLNRDDCGGDQEVLVDVEVAGVAAGDSSSSGRSAMALSTTRVVCRMSIALPNMPSGVKVSVRGVRLYLRHLVWIGLFILATHVPFTTLWLALIFVAVALLFFWFCARIW